MKINNSLIICNNTIYRPAGYRIPQMEEYYIAKDGFVKQRSFPDTIFDSPRLIVRPPTVGDYCNNPGELDGNN
jgi:hypothetical protein